MVKNLLILCFLAVFAFGASAQSLWADMPESGLPAGEKRIQPAKYRTVKLNVPAMRALLATAPERFTVLAESAQRPTLALPLPDGSVQRFLLEETPVMHPALQQKYPQIRTYTGRGLDDPTALLKCDLTPWGFHAMVLSAQRGSYFIDPAIHGNDEFYVVYNKKDYLPKKTDQPWTCEVPAPSGAQELGPKNDQPTWNGPEQGDTKLRRYRLALACTGEYATYHGGTKPLALAAMNTTMNRVNGVYERDFAVTMQIIPNNDAIIFLNAATDPYSNGNGSAMLNQNQTTCNNLIGTANYDIGHVFSTGGGGIAGLGVVCGSSKANGVTGSGNPVGDPFDIDYVAHEMGHQFNGNHTFNNCGGTNNQISAVEPGSGSTIMAYAGICPQNVQPNSDDYFHGYNITEMGSFIYNGNGNNCPVKINTTNNNPTADAGPNRTIPRGTPFYLTAIGTDVDGDTLTYNWEQMNTGNAGAPPSPTATAGPLFRSFPSSLSPTRYFPRLSDLVNNATYAWERLPAEARSMSFRVTVRDNDWYAGCTAEDDMVITVAGNSGPFVVTEPNTNVLWYVGETKTVTWDVANTTAAPVSCANVRITLSLDGGFTYPVELAASVPNNGSADITVPNNLSNNCRVRVESVGNIFFDISNANFRIQLPPNPTFLMNLSSSNLNICAGEEGNFGVQLEAIAGFSNDVSFTLSGLPAGATATIDPNPAPQGAAVGITISDITADMAGTYALTLTGTGGTETRNVTVNLNVFPGAPGAASGPSPVNAATGLTTSTALSWAEADHAVAYLVEVATNPSFSPASMVFSGNTDNPSASLAGLQDETVYYWRVRSDNDCGAGDYSETWAFQTGRPDCGNNFSSTDVPVVIPSTISTISSTISVNENRIVSDVNVSIAILHSWVGDLSAQLVSPQNDTITLFDQPGVPATQYGCDGDNANLTFDAQAAQTSAALEAQCNSVAPALSGTFQPIGSLDVANGKSAQGTWRLLVSDNYPDDGGSLTAWSLSFCFPNPIANGNILVNEPLTVIEGQSEAIFQSHLAMEISGIQELGVFTLLSLPAHGTLSLNGTVLNVGDTFTQEDINNAVLVYTHNGDAATEDSFLFDALDQNNQAWVHGETFRINILASNLSVSASVTANVLCHNDATGQITVVATGLNGVFTYSLNGAAAQSDNVFSNLPAGTYTIVVTGQGGLTATAGPIVLDNPASLDAGVTVNDNDVIVTASGGTGNLEYSIDGENFQAENEFLDLPNGLYTLTVRDENGCVATVPFIVAANTLIAIASVQEPIACAGGETGVISVAVGGGQQPYTYSLNGGPGQTSNVFSGLPAGTYFVEVTDHLGLSTVSGPIVLSAPDPILVTASAVLNVISVTASGGTGGLEYSIDGQNFQGSSFFVNLPNATYTVTVRDENGCTATAVAIVNVTPLSGSLQASPILCFGGSTSIVVTANDGIPPYQYQLGFGQFQSSPVFANIGAGSYTVMVRDASGTTLMLGPITIAQPPMLGVQVTVTGNDGVLTFTGGTPPYSYTTNAPNADLQNLPNGTYSVTAADGNGCTATTSFFIDVPPLALSVNMFTNVSCFGASDGALSIIATGGIPPYTYSLNGGPFTGNNTFENLSAAVYSVVVRDADGNTMSMFVTVGQPDPVQVSVGTSGGTINASASGGTSPYQYSLNGGAPQSSGTFSNLPSGTYTVEVVDANGCTGSASGIIVVNSVVELGAAWGLTVSPNPSEGLFTLTMSNAPSLLKADVFDETGRLLRSFEFQSAGAAFSASLDLQLLPQGMYLLRLSGDNQWGSVRLSKVGR
jgi:subtilisin-like proprotein convertase family protein